MGSRPKLMTIDSGRLLPCKCWVWARVFRCIEHGLYNYDTTLKEMRTRERIIEAPPLRGGFGTGHVSDPTARKATQLVTNTDLARMARMAGRWRQ